MYALVAVGLLAFTASAAWFITHPARSYNRNRVPAIWARERGLELTPRSLPFVEAYLRNGEGLRPVCAIGGYFLAAAITAATGIDLHVSGLVWMLCGYVVAILWVELTLARVPAGETRVASLSPRTPTAYLGRAVKVGRLVVPAIAVALGAVCLALPADESRAARMSFAGTSRSEPMAWSRQAALVSLALALVITALSLLAEARIARRPQPTAEPDLTAADDAMRAASVHQIAIAEMAAVLLLIGGELAYLVNSVDAPLSGVLMFVMFLLLPLSWFVWSWRRNPLTRSRLGVADGPPVPPAAGPGVQQWDAPRRPALLAGVTIVVACVALAAVGWWGPVNPSVTVAGQGSLALANDRQGIELLVTNRSGSAVELVGARLQDLVGPANAARVLGLSGVTFDDANGSVQYTATMPDQTPVADLPAHPLTIGPRQRARIVAEVERPVCPGPVEEPLAGFTVDLDLRTTSGRVMTVPTTLPDKTVDCRVHLDNSAPPADPATARAAITKAFAIVYDTRVDAAAKAGLIDDARELEATATAALQGPYAATVASTRAAVTDIGFDRVGHAVVLYRLDPDLAAGGGAGPSGTRHGEAVLIDGAWKVTRTTICADLALANVTCPPLPG